jgi:hypothetical protein
MKKRIVTSAALLLLAAGCGGGTGKDGDVALVDVRATYPQKELILQDFLDVEYIPLESSDEIVTHGYLLAVGKNILIVKNQVDDGDILIFDRQTGKHIRTFNHRGMSGQEYVYIYGLALDESRKEIFVNDYPGRKILVYDPEGNFKRSFRLKEGAQYNRMFVFDIDNLIGYEVSFNKDGKDDPAYLLISKHDGSIVSEIRVPGAGNLSTVLSKMDEANNRMIATLYSTEYPLIPYGDEWILVEASSDTIYRYTFDYTLEPFIIRQPAIRSMDPYVFLYPSIVTERYCLMDAVRQEYDFDTGIGFPVTRLLYDKRRGRLYTYILYNGDYIDKRPLELSIHPVNAEIASWQALDAASLVEARDAGLLQGRLAEVASGLDAESNPVLILLKHKK